MFTLLKRISQGNLEWNGGGAKLVVQKTAGVSEVDAVTTLIAQISAMQNMMTTQFNNMSLGQQQAQVNMVQKPPTWCEVCGGRDHNAKVWYPKYVKYMKDVVANKSRLVEYATVALTEECNSRIQNRLPTKLKDLGSFTVQIKIGKCIEARGLCDLGASINLMSTSMFLKLGLGRPKSTTIMLQLADLSIARPDGVIEDVLSDLEVQFILGHLFLATGGALIDMTAGRLTMRAHEVFYVYKAMKLPAIYEDLSAIIDIEGDAEAQELAIVLDVPNVSMLRKFVEPLNRVLGPPPKPSIEEAPKLELKALPSHLRYAFLGANESLPVILSSALSEIQVDASLKILRKRKKAIGWQMADIHGISPALCMHMIFTEEGHKSSVQPQCRLYPMMKVWYARCD
ncbi:hypothetical protein R3W88_029597 [Solanum pinnatisectum]|uniref:Uncharacterized protein n=1 Tax=Solanum pinnatisectum TaxID=50273 RepID=A0AAV9K984_9SOLN|nr:hypothetical protein R3W88_029597 [Solanum pinnatisectum]